jgi:uncharacterized protein with GYD domain
VRCHSAATARYRERLEEARRISEEAGARLAGVYVTLGR